MKLENQVCSLELAKKLKESGVKQDSLWYWTITRTTDWHLSIAGGDKKLLPDDYYSAFTVAELGEMLSPTVYNVKCTDNKQWVCGSDYCARLMHEKDGKWRNHKVFRELTEADARAKMLIYLLHNNLTKQEG